MEVPHSCGSASSRVAPASRRSSCGRGSGAMACSRRSAPPAATGSTRTTTSSACDGCGSCSDGALGGRGGQAGCVRATRACRGRAGGGRLCRAPPRTRAARRRRRARRVRPPAGRLLHQSRARQRRPAAPARARRRLGARRDLHCAGALRLEPAPRSPARPCARVGPRHWPARGTRVSAGRAARSGTRDLRALTPGARLADHVLGSDTPLDTIVETVERLEPEALVLAVTDAARLEGVADTVSRVRDAGTDRLGRRRGSAGGRRRARARRVGARGG